MSESTAVARRRPVILTIAVVFIYLTGVTNTVVGILILLSRYRVEADAVLAISLLGAGVILFGLLTIGVGSGVARGSRLARLTVTVYLAIGLALQVVTLISTDPWDASAIVIVVVQLFIAFALWAPPASRYFAPSTAPLSPTV